MRIGFLTQFPSNKVYYKFNVRCLWGLELISVTESVYFKLQSFFLVITENWVRNSSNFFAISGVVGFRRTDKAFFRKIDRFLHRDPAESLFSDYFSKDCSRSGAQVMRL